MEEVGQGIYEFGHSTLLDVWSSKNRQAYNVKEFILENIKQRNLSDEQHQLIKHKVDRFISFIKAKLPKCNRMLERFKTKHSRWLALNMMIDLSDCRLPVNKRGRSDLDNTDAGPRLTRQLVSELTAKQSPLQISADKALTFLIDNGLTKQQYINIKELNKRHGCDIYPPYSEIVNSKNLTLIKRKKINKKKSLPNEVIADDDDADEVVSFRPENIVLKEEIIDD